MIFGSLFRRAENAVGNILDQALARVLVALPLLVAAGFATAAASGYLSARYGRETSNLIMAAGFGALALLIAGYVATWPAVQAGQSESATETAAAGDASASGESAAQAETMSPSERELLNSVLASAAPLALPAILRLLLRNLPLLLAVLVAGYMLSRETERPVAVPAE